MIKFGFVGCGRIAEKHAHILGNRLVEGAQLVSVCDIIQSKAKKIGEEYSVPYYTDMHIMMQNEAMDAVVIMTESGNHAKHTIKLAGYKKHIIVEKPMALTLNDADKMIEACASNSIKLFVVKQNRFNLPVQKLRQAIEAGKFGRIFMGTVRLRWCREQSYYDQAKWRGTWAMDGGVLTNQASHHIDLLEWMLGDVESVFAKSITFSANIEAEDTAVVILKFKSGALGIIEATTATRPHDIEGSISILGNCGSAEIAGFAVNKLRLWSFSGDDDLSRQDKTAVSEEPPDVYGFGHKRYYEHVIDCIINNKKHLIDGFEGRKSLELINAIYESIETQKEVYLRFTPRYCKLGA